MGVTQVRHNIFVYGTLKRAYWNHRLISCSKNSKFLGTFFTSDEYYFSSQGIPFMVKKPCLVTNHNQPTVLKARVLGEVWSVTSEDGTLASLDRLEGHPTMYRREPLQVSGLEDEEVEGYFYQHKIVGDEPEEVPNDFPYHSYNPSN